MTPRFIHIGIEQVLQNIGSNIYSNFKRKEIDLQFNTVCDKFVDAILGKDIDNNDRTFFEDSQLTLDKLRLLKVYDTLLIPTNNLVTLPNDYRDLLNDRSLINFLSCVRTVSNKEIEAGTYYKNNLNVAIVYNNQLYNPNEIFLGIENIAIFTIVQMPFTGSVIALLDQPNRLIEVENKADYIRSNFTKPVWYSPVSELYQDKIKVYKGKDFTIDGVIIEYIRKINYLDSDNWLIDWNTEFSDTVIKHLIDATAKRLMFIVESKKYPASNNELVK